MATLSTELVPKVPNTFVCKKCNYFTHRYSHYQRHILTKKHVATLINRICTESTNQYTDISILKRNYICELCEKKYTERSGLWRHKQICIKIPINKEENKLEPDTHTNVNNDVTGINKLTELVMNVVKQNNELTKQIIELSSKPTTTNNNTTNNNSFNLQFFLNETCKDALNITDFINQLQVGTKDLEETGRLGYAEGISKIFINGLKKLNVNQRPVHCSDAKRETIYIKDGGQWEKDNDEKVKLTNAIRDVAHKNIEQIQVWTEQHPEYTDLKSKYNDRYMKLIGEAMSGSTNEETYRNYKKIARNIMKETIIPK
jgi:hypothetical protein